MGIMPLISQGSNNKNMSQECDEALKIMKSPSSLLQILSRIRPDYFRLWSIYLEALDAGPTEVPDRCGNLMCVVQRWKVKIKGPNLTVPRLMGSTRDNLRGATEGIHQEEKRQG